jgi:DNA-binding transcriptional MocR family regulator
VTPGVALCVDAATARQAFRLGFTNLDEDEITRAVELLTTAAP